MAGTDDALRRRLDDRKLRLMEGSSFRSGPASSKISRSTRPEYRNLVPHEKKLPPVTTDGASELDGNLQLNAVFCSSSYQHIQSPVHVYISFNNANTKVPYIRTFHQFLDVSVIKFYKINLGKFL